MSAKYFVTVIASGFAALTTIACSSATKSSASSSCRLTAADSALIASSIYTDCSVDQRAVGQQTDVRIDAALASAGPRGEACYYAEVQFVVGTDGRPMPGTARLLRTNYQAVADAVLASVPTWQYRPAVLDGQPVRQLVKERKIIATMTRVVVVSRGSAPPATSPSGPPPNCR